jgi:hypothetical protein
VGAAHPPAVNGRPGPRPPRRPNDVGSSATHPVNRRPGPRAPDRSNVGGKATARSTGGPATRRRTVPWMWAAAQPPQQPAARPRFCPVGWSQVRSLGVGEPLPDNPLSRWCSQSPFRACMWRVGVHKHPARLATHNWTRLTTFAYLYVSHLDDSDWVDVSTNGGATWSGPSARSPTPGMPRVWPPTTPLWRPGSGRACAYYAGSFHCTAWRLIQTRGPTRSDRFTRAGSITSGSALRRLGAPWATVHRRVCRR